MLTDNASRYNSKLGDSPVASRESGQKNPPNPAPDQRQGGAVHPTLLRECAYRTSNERQAVLPIHSTHYNRKRSVVP